MVTSDTLSTHYTRLFTLLLIHLSLLRLVLAAATASSDRKSFSISVMSLITCMSLLRWLQGSLSMSLGGRNRVGECLAPNAHGGSGQLVGLGWQVLGQCNSALMGVNGGVSMELWKGVRECLLVIERACMQD